MSKENKYEKELRRREKRSSYFYDMSKIVMGGTVLAVVPYISIEGNELNEPVIYTFSLGLCLTIAFAMIGDRILKY